jgi:hypothetical protein
LANTARSHSKVSALKGRRDHCRDGAEIAAMNQPMILDQDGAEKRGTPAAGVAPPADQ